MIGHPAEANREGMQAITDQATEWERWRNATFESNKTVETASVHFTRNTAQA